MTPQASWRIPRSGGRDVGDLARVALVGALLVALVLGSIPPAQLGHAADTPLGATLTVLTTLPTPPQTIFAPPPSTPAP